ncbi:DUF397 domain-containing protein [Actinomadura parmotrematis]|uniref:DUF397 domain-containing protein n=1 Tax=Actinomadura parmotrematis TaxID=2864039 RepID=A0ABS7G6J9_9ACTN|nr:DUF397 domain-containing protein [Actinomadura parmotrematis]MBW8487437.1 DUF397 domain-containing protein [Actinomadura parmotrematis]
MRVGNASARPWAKSSRCASNTACIEVTRLHSADIGVRDGGLGESAPVLSIGSTSWDRLLSKIKAGELDS